MKLNVNLDQKKCWFLHQENVEIAYQNAKDRDQKNDNGMIFDME